MPDLEVPTPGYAVYRADRTDPKQVGDVALFVLDGAPTIAHIFIDPHEYFEIR